MNWFDLVALFIIAIGALHGLANGFVRQVLSIIGLVGGALLAGQRYEVLAERLTLLPDPNYAKVVSFVLIFVAALVAANLLGQILRRMTRLAMLGCVDQAAGFVFGVAEAVVVIQVILLLILRFNIGEPACFLGESMLGSELLKYAPLTLNLLPEEFTEALNEALKTLPLG